MTEQAFEGVTVIEDARLISGPYAGKLFADLGARVIKIEPPGGDPARFHPPFAGDEAGPDRSLLFTYLNTNKESLTLDLESAEGREVFLKLLERADLLIQDRSDRELTGWGWGPEELAARFPDLVNVSITPFGRSGPYKDFVAHHLNICHISGESHLLQTSDITRPPVKVGAYMGEYDVGVQAAVSAAGGLIRRKRRGGGCFVDISKQEVLMSLDKVDLLRYGNDKYLVGRGIGAIMTGGMVACKDGYVVIVIAQDHQWKGLVEFLGSPEWSKKKMCKNEFTRAMAAFKINSFIAESLKDYTMRDLFHGGQAQGVPIAAVFKADDILRSRQLAARGFFVEVDLLAVGRTVRMPGCPAHMSGTPWRLKHLAPALGSATDEILGRELGLGAGEIEELRRKGVA